MHYSHPAHSQSTLRRTHIAGYLTSMYLTSTLMLVGLSIILALPVRGEDWPTYRHDQRRSGLTAESIDPSRLIQAWQWSSAQPPSPAWPDAARWDAYALLDGLRSMRNYDPVFHPIVVGDRIYIPSSSDDTLRCLSLTTGAVLWTYTADAPIRIAPTAFEDTLYFGADDGCVVALKLIDGTELWKSRGVASRQTFLNDGRICSLWPIRSGVVIDEVERVAVVAGGMFPWQSSSLIALDLESGAKKWERDLGKGWTLEGAMLLSPNHIIAPQGRAAPQLFSRTNGEPLGLLNGGGGSFVLLTDDNEVLHGPGNKGGWITQSNADSREKVASFERGTAVVVDGKRSYLLDDEKLAAMDRESGAIEWVANCDCPHELILAGTTLFAGGTDQIKAFDAQTGKTLWVGAVVGRALGMLVANGHLLVVTDEGHLVAFTPTGETQPTDHLPTAVAPALTEVLSTAPAVKAIDDPYLLERWVFQEDQVLALDEKRKELQIKSAAPGGLGLPAPLIRHARIVQAGEEHALLLDGRAECAIAADFSTVAHPQQALTASAWVRLDKPQAWGGIVGIMQDNGSYEKGWILGYQNDRFGFAVNGQDGPDQLTWILSDKSVFTPGAWHLVVGTYDGTQMQLFVDSQLAASSTEQRGAINYPPQAPYHVAAYKDDDEHFISQGMLNEVRVYERALAAEEITALYAEKHGNFPVRASEVEITARSKYEGTVESAIHRGPFLEFTAPQTATIRWWTQTPQPTQLEIQEHPYSKAKLLPLPATQPTTEHVALIGNIRPHEVIKYRIAHQVNGEQQLTGYFECDGHFDFTRPTLPPANLLPDAVLGQAKRLFELTDHKEPRGLAIVLGAFDEAKFAEAVSQISNVDVVVLDASRDRVAAARARLVASGVYGRAISVRHIESSLDVGLPNRTADFLLVDPLAGSIANETNGLLGQTDLNDILFKIQPSGRALLPAESIDLPPGAVTTEPATYTVAPLDPAAQRDLAALGYSQPVQVLTAAKRSGAADWTHMYGTSDNTAYAGETLAGASSQNDLMVVWAGRPGPRYQSDRGNRKPSPLSSSGRLYLQGLRRVIALDAHNGTILWSLELPEALRFNVPRDCSNWCVDDNHIYLAAKGRCLVIDSATGAIESQFKVYDPMDKQLDWGFVAREEELLISSGVARENTFTEFWGPENWYDSKDGEAAKKVCSDILYAAYHGTGDMVWSYDEGLVVNPTITIADGRVYFMVSKSEALKANDARRLDGEEFWSSMHMVALDAKTGEKLWDVPAHPMEGKSAAYVASADGKLILATSKDGAFGVYAMDAASGKNLWRGKFDWEVDHHGKHLSRPAIVEGKIYLRPLTLDLDTGAVLSQEFPLGHQCGTYTASRDALFLRAGELAVWNRKTGESTRWDRARPDCWISTIPAQGMLLSPEGGGGCSCGGWIETSMGFAPRSEQAHTPALTSGEAANVK